MSYFSYTCLYVFASVFVGVFSQNYYGVSKYEDTPTIQNCSCPSNELYLNAKNSSLVLPAMDLACLNIPCIDCKWHINISYADPNDSAYITYGQDFQLCKSRLIMTNCKNNIAIIDSSSSAQLNENEYANGYLNTFYIQENELCINLNTTGSGDVCNYYSTSRIFCWFQLTLKYQKYTKITVNMHVVSKIFFVELARGRKCVNVMTDLYVNWIDGIDVN
jgi:hypothetical protein